MPRILLFEEQKQLHLNRLLLNPGDEITVKVLLTQYDGKFIPSSRIAGIKQVENFAGFRRTKEHLRSVLLLMFFAFYTFVSGALIFLGKLGEPAIQISDWLQQLLGFSLIAPGFMALAFLPLAFSPRLQRRMESKIQYSYPKLWAWLESREDGWGW